MVKERGKQWQWHTALGGANSWLGTNGAWPHCPAQQVVKTCGLLFQVLNHNWSFSALGNVMLSSGSKDWRWHRGAGNDNGCREQDLCWVQYHSWWSNEALVHLCPLSSWVKERHLYNTPSSHTGSKMPLNWVIWEGEPKTNQCNCELWVLPPEQSPQQLFRITWIPWN